MGRRTSDIAFFIALLSTALAMGAALAHALELPNKIGMAREPYFTVQQIYRGWNLLALLLLVEIASMAAVAWIERQRRTVLLPTLSAVASLVMAQILFWIFTYPANRATDNWLLQPANWTDLRQQWEYSHAAGAALQVIAMALMIVAVLRRSDKAVSAPG